MAEHSYGDLRPGDRGGLSAVDPPACDASGSDGLGTQPGGISGGCLLWSAPGHRRHGGAMPFRTAEGGSDRSCRRALGRGGGGRLPGPVVKSEQLTRSCLVRSPVGERPSLRQRICGVISTEAVALVRAMAVFVDDVNY